MTMVDLDLLQILFCRPRLPFRRVEPAPSGEAVPPGILEHEPRGELEGFCGIRVFE